MYSNGVATGMEVIANPLKPIQKVPIVGRPAWAVAVAGTAPARGAAACRVVTTPARRSVTTTSACALPSEVNFSLFVG